MNWAWDLLFCHLLDCPVMGQCQQGEKGDTWEVSETSSAHFRVQKRTLLNVTCQDIFTTVSASKPKVYRKQKESWVATGLLGMWQMKVYGQIKVIVSLMWSEGVVSVRKGSVTKILQEAKDLVLSCSSTENWTICIKQPLCFMSSGTRDGPGRDILCWKHLKIFLAQDCPLWDKFEVLRWYHKRIKISH